MTPYCSLDASIICSCAAVQIASIRGIAYENAYGKDSVISDNRSV